MAKRKRIGRWNDIATRQAVYQTDAGLEVDELDHFEINRKRVFYDDILLVTMHRYIGVWFVVTMLVFGIGFLVIGALTRDTTAVIVFSIIAAPFLIMALVRVIARIDVITVFGKRSRARMRFMFRKTYARRIYAEISAKAREAQRRLAADIEAAEPPQAPPLATDEVPMPPAE
ncbi:MAG: hypothetical protein JWO97_4300 [Acidobacteria bacterium]|nr:hypothetical protein [Acidobacteriota bacterium]